MEYKNREGNTFTFEYNKDGNIDWCGDFEYVRFSFNTNPEEITMLDPSGGPCINVGYDMSKIGLKGIVKAIIENEDCYELILKKK